MYGAHGLLDRAERAGRLAIMTFEEGMRGTGEAG